MNDRTCIIFALTLAVYGCNDPNSSAEAEVVRSQISVSANEIPAFVQSSSNSLLDVKDGSERAYRGAVYVTKNGATYVRHSNGWTTNLLDAEAQKGHGIYRGSGEEHSESVGKLLQNSGIPTDQMGGIAAIPFMLLPAASEEDANKGVAPKPELAGYQSRLQRQIEGIVVTDSFAVVSLDDTGQVIAESIFWPSIPRGIVDRALALRDELSKPDQRDAYVKKLGEAGKRAGKVVIRHTPAIFTGEVTAYAAYDVEGEGSDTEQHFDADGNKFRLANEDPQPAAAPVDDPRSAGWTDDPSCGVLGSQWRLSAAKDPSVFVGDGGTWTFKTPQVEMEGSMKVLQPGAISIEDTRATGAEICPQGLQGSYTTLWRSECQELQLIVINDDCVGRRHMLHALALSRVK